MALVAGLTIADRFRLKRLIGVGGTGWVWEAKDLQTKELVALTILRDDVAEDLITQARFRREADTVASFDHPGIANFLTGSSGCHLPSSQRVVFGAATIGLVIEAMRKMASSRMAQGF